MADKKKPSPPPPPPGGGGSDVPPDPQNPLGRAKSDAQIRVQGTVSQDVNAASRGVEGVDTTGAEATLQGSLSHSLPTTSLRSEDSHSESDFSSTNKSIDEIGRAHV